MTEHRIGTREEWRGARAELAALEAEHADERLQGDTSEMPSTPSG